LLGFDVHPGHFHGAGVAGRAGSQLFFAVYIDLSKTRTESVSLPYT
jgi:hypothetical protein